MIHPKSVVIVAFETLELARKSYASPEYALTIPMRQRAANANLVIMEGLPPEYG